MKKIKKRIDSRRFARKRKIYLAYQKFIKEITQRIEYIFPKHNFMRKHEITCIQSESERVIHLYRRGFISDEIFLAKSRSPELHLSEERIKKGVVRAIRSLVDQKKIIVLSA